MMDSTSTRKWHDEYLRKLWFIDDDLWRIIDQRIPNYYKDYQYRKDNT